MTSNGISRARARWRQKATAAIDRCEGPMRHNNLTPFAALAVIAVGSLWLGTATAHADPIVVRPGLTCDDSSGVINCNNATNTDYTVTQRKECAGGDYSSTDYTSGFDS